MPDLENDKPPQHPLGSLFFKSPPAQRKQVRINGLLVGIISVSLLTVAAYVTPDPSGMGTHTQLGQPECSWVRNWNIPCPTCGMTTAFAHTVRGNLLTAFKTQPFGFFLALATMFGALWSLQALLTGRCWRINWFRIRPGIFSVVVVILLLAAWGYKVLATRGNIG